MNRNRIDRSCLMDRKRIVTTANRSGVLTLQESNQQFDRICHQRSSAATRIGPRRESHVTTAGRQLTADSPGTLADSGRSRLTVSCARTRTTPGAVAGNRWGVLHGGAALAAGAVQAARGGRVGGGAGARAGLRGPPGPRAAAGVRRRPLAAGRRRRRRAPHRTPSHLKRREGATCTARWRSRLASA